MEKHSLSEPVHATDAHVLAFAKTSIDDVLDLVFAGPSVGQMDLAKQILQRAYDVIAAHGELDAVAWRIAVDVFHGDVKLACGGIFLGRTEDAAVAAAVAHFKALYPKASEVKAVASPAGTA